MSAANRTTDGTVPEFVGVRPIPPRRLAILTTVVRGSGSQGLESLAHRPLHRFADPLDPVHPAGRCGLLHDLGWRRSLPLRRNDRSLADQSSRSPSHATPDGRSQPVCSTGSNAHRNGRRSGDQFCVYVFDFFGAPRLTADDITAVVTRTRKLDADIGHYVREHLCLSLVRDRRWGLDPCAGALPRHGRDHGALPSINPGRIEAP